MEDRLAQAGGQGRGPGGQRVVEDDRREHGRIEQRGKVVVEVQDATHGPEGDVM